MSDLIDREALLESLIYCEGLGRKSCELVAITIKKQTTVNEQEIRNKAIENYKTALIERYEHGKSINAEFAYLDLADVMEIAEQMKEVGECPELEKRW